MNKNGGERLFCLSPPFTLPAVLQQELVVDRLEVWSVTSLRECLPSLVPPDNTLSVDVRVDSGLHLEDLLDSLINSVRENEVQRWHNLEVTPLVSIRLRIEALDVEDAQMLSLHLQRVAVDAFSEDFTLDDGAVRHGLFHGVRTSELCVHVVTVWVNCPITRGNDELAIGS